MCKYNARQFVDSMVAQKSGVPLFRQVLQYDDIGRITKQTSQHTGQAEREQTYQYDRQNFLRYHWEEVGVRGEQYVYDAIGNREATGRYENSQGVWSEIHHYLSSSHPNQLRQREHIDSYNNRDTTFYAYNASGAMKNRAQGGSVEDFYYDNIQGLVKRYKRTNGSIVGEWQYRYSASGERELKREHQTQGVVAPKRWQYYLLGLGGEQLAVYEGHEVEQPTCGYFASQFTPQLFISASEYLVYGLGDVHNITSKPVDPTKNWNEYKVVDHLGSTRVVVDESGAIAGQYDYKPFGEVLWQSAPVPRKNWIDKETDAENGLGDFGVRKYDDGLGRFTSIDPLWEKYRAWSPYVYSMNNPMTLKDPNGESAVATVSEDGKTITVKATIYFYGDEVHSPINGDMAAQWGEAISKYWTEAGKEVEINGKKYQVKFEIKGVMVSEKQARELAAKNRNEKDYEKNFVRVDMYNDRNSSYTHTDFYHRAGNAGYWRRADMAGNGLYREGMYNLAAHEFGHMLGFRTTNGSDHGEYGGGIPDLMDYYSGSDKNTRSYTLRASTIARIFSGKKIVAGGSINLGEVLSNKIYSKARQK